jgi:hypothetical protein
MSEELVPTKKTPVTMQGYARGLARAWRLLFGAYPTKGQAGVLWAQYGVETGAGPWCWNFNIGNEKHVAGDGFDYVMLVNVKEIVSGVAKYFQPPHPATWFRAFDSLDASMVDHLKFLHGKRYAAAWEGVELENCGIFARLLKAGGYFTADANDYAAGMRAHFDRWMKATAFEDALLELVGEQERETVPEVEDPPSSAPTTIANVETVHPAVPMGRPWEDEDSPPSA